MTRKNKSKTNLILFDLAGKLQENIFDIYHWTFNEDFHCVIGNSTTERK